MVKNPRFRTGNDTVSWNKVVKYKPADARQWNFLPASIFTGAPELRSNQIALRLDNKAAKHYFPAMRIAEQPRQSGRSHEWIDQRSLALHEEVAQMLQQKPELLGKAKTTLARWIEQRPTDVPAVLVEWQNILETWPIEKTLELLRSPDEDARRLRQSSPFCGFLTPEKRLEILKEYEALRA
jgi:hypothetical protein